MPGDRDNPPPASGNWQRAILDSVADGVFTVDHEWSITSFNRAAERITGVPRAEAIGRRCCEVFRASICERDCALRQTVETGKPVVNKAIYIVNAEGQRVPISISTALLRDEAGQVIGGVETFRDLTLVEQLRKELSRRDSFADIVSRNHDIHRIFEVMPAIAESDSTVVITGPSGSGKELFAKAIHSLSPRADGPWVPVNCAALPDALLESELFGYVAGAFTDARNDKPGRFAVADGGTIFLDEIGDISPAMQVRLLRVLQDGMYEPLGSTTPRKADVRVIAATNSDLEDLVRQGRFRSDLYYRINVVKISLPPLAQRREDIPLLADHFMAKFNRLRGKDISGLSDQVVAALMAHDFPGNVRELENVIEHAFVLCRGGLIEPEHLPAHLRPKRGTRRFAGRKLADVEARCIIDALQRNNWNRSAVARELGIHKTTLWRKIRSLGIALPQRPLPRK
ncbi:MAG TPA: sigma 54-interacting transcriptional regulator [Phycisphaerae bacterium]|nr:sigma 54-interacting transcriptional regulator [Phycisphaerae bacterium]